MISAQLVQQLVATVAAMSAAAAVMLFGPGARDPLEAVLAAMLVLIVVLLQPMQKIAYLLTNLSTRRNNGSAVSLRDVTRRLRQVSDSTFRASLAGLLRTLRQPFGLRNRWASKWAWSNGFDIPKLIRPSALLPLLRNVLFRAHGWLAGTALGLWLALRTSALLRELLFATKFEALAEVVALGIGVLGGMGVGVALDRFPVRVSRWRLGGSIEGRAGDAVLEFGANAMLVLFGVSIASIVSSVNFAPETSTQNWLTAAVVFSLPLVSLAALTAYATPWLVMRKPAPAKRGLWVVDLAGVRTGSAFGSVYLKLIDALARHWRDGPVTMLLNAGTQASGEHTVAAEDASRLRLLYPGIAVELADWAQLLPPVDRWDSLPVRELHASSELMVSALKQFIGPNDDVVLLARSAAPLAQWRDVLRHTRCLVAWLGPQTTDTRSVAGFDAIPVRANGLVDGSSLCKSVRMALERSPQAIVALPREANRDAAAGAGEVVGDGRAAADSDSPGGQIAVQAVGEVAGPDAPAIAEHAAQHRKKVFVSYSSAYRDLVARLIVALESVGVEPMHDRLLPAGQAWSDALVSMLVESDAVVVLAGSATAASHHQMREINHAIDAGKLLIPVIVDRFEEPKAVLAFMAANIHPQGEIAYLSDCAPNDLDAVVHASAQRVVAALARRTVVVKDEGREASGQSSQAPPLNEVAFQSNDGEDSKKAVILRLLAALHRLSIVRTSLLAVAV